MHTQIHIHSATPFHEANKQSYAYKTLNYISIQFATPFHEAVRQTYA